MRHAVIFHEIVSRQRECKDGVISCTIAPNPMHNWKQDTTKPIFSYEDKINRVINNAKDDISVPDYENIDDYTKGYGQGYINGLKYALEIYRKE